MTRFNPTLRIIEARIVLTIRKYCKLTRAEALMKLREVTSGHGIETVRCFSELQFSKNREESVNQLFKV